MTSTGMEEEEEEEKKKKEEKVYSKLTL